MFAFKNIFMLVLLIFIVLSTKSTLTGQTGSNESLELIADKPFFRKKGKTAKVDIPKARAFQIPETIEVTKGNPYTLIGKFKAKAKGKGSQGLGNIKCTYAHKNRFRGAVAYFFDKLFGRNPSNKIPLEKCSKKFQAGDESLAKKFSMQLESGLRFFRPAGRAKISIEFKDTTPTEMVNVPDLVGLTRSEAEGSLQAAGLALGTPTESHSDLPIGEVISQNPSAGRSVEVGSIVAFEISIGPRMVAVPQLIGLIQSEAETTLISAELSLGVVVELFNPTVAAGVVMDQTPLSGVSLLVESPVNLTVSKGAEKVLVPDLVGLTKIEAEQALLDARLNLGARSEAYSGRPINEVLAQYPVLGTSVDVGSGVDIEVSIGPRVATVPQLIGLTRTDAENAITGAELNLSSVTEVFSTTAPAGLVVAQSPNAGTSLATGSNVNLIVSQGPQVSEVPLLVGLSLIEAEQALANAGLSRGVITEISSDRPLNEVLSQTPALGISVVIGSPVALEISLGSGITKVPQLVGLSKYEAESVTAAANLTLDIEEYFDSTFPKDTVMYQSPNSGSSVAEGSSVNIEVSRGPQMVSVPNLLGLSLDDIEQALIAAGLRLGAVTDDYSDRPKNEVLSQIPASEASVPIYSTVDIEVSNGIVLVTVPTVTGIDESQARILIAEAGLTTLIKYVKSDTIPTGQIISQDPDANSQLKESSKVRLVISGGPQAGYVGGDETLTPEPAVLYEQREACIENNPISAPDLPTGREASFYEQFSFLFTSNNPMQTGVADGTIEEKNMAIIMGYLRRANGEPIAGAKLSIPKMPKYGETFTGNCGEYYLVVNGNELLTIEFSIAGFLTAQRTISADKGIFEPLDDVVLKPLDPNVTSINLAEISNITIADGSVIQDERGIRQAAIAVIPGTSATAKYSDGSEAQLSNVNIRITEYTVGESGPQSMPANLPPNTAYTYAAEFSIDEAFGSEIVEFSKPVLFMMDDFIGFDVPDGSLVPAGYYSRTQSRWIAENDGLSLTILDFSNEKALIDLNSDGNPENEETLDIVGIGDEHLSALYLKYASAQLPKSVWLVEMEHFSPIDLNFSTESLKPERVDGDIRDLNKLRNEKNECSPGSIIFCESRLLGQNIPIVGTDHFLAYRSERQPGYLLENQIKTELDLRDVGDNSPIKDKWRMVTIAGRTFSRYSSGEIDGQTWKMLWDGKDRFGRDIVGPTTATIRSINYVNTWYVVDSILEANGAIRIPASSFGEYPRTYGGVNVRYVESLVKRSYKTKWTETVGSNEYSSQKMGGWHLGTHHVKSKNSAEILLGTGETIQTKFNPKKIRLKHKGDGSPYTYKNTELGPDGSFYYLSAISHSSAQRISKFNPVNREIKHIYGLDEYGESPVDGSDAREVSLNICVGVGNKLEDFLDFGPDGDLYYLECSRGTTFMQYKLRKIDLSTHQISTVAGIFDKNLTENEKPLPGDTGNRYAKEVVLAGDLYEFEVASDGSIILVQDFNSAYTLTTMTLKKIRTNGKFFTLIDESQSTQDAINLPFLTNFDPSPSADDLNFGNHYIDFLTLDNHDDIYFKVHNKIFKLKDNQLNIFVGNGSYNDFYRVDGIPATDYTLDRFTRNIKFDSLGRMFIFLDTSIHMVDLSGLIYTVVGSRTPHCCQHASGDIYASDLNMFIDFSHIYIDKNDTLNFGGYHNQKYYHWTLDSETEETAASNGEYFIFDGRGLHSETRNQVTGALVYQFAYNEENLLTSIIDSFGNATDIQREPDGSIESIIGPFGQTTNLSLNADGFLSSLTHPDGSTYEFDYHQTDGMSNGLLSSFSDPLKHKKEYTFNEIGLLNSAINPKGNAKTIISNTSPKEKHVTLVSPENRETTYKSKFSGSKLRAEHIKSTEYPNGLVKETISIPRSEEVINYQGSTSFTSKFKADPVFGIQGRYKSYYEIKPNSIYSVNYTTNRLADRTDALNIYDFKSMTEEVIINNDPNKKYITTTDRVNETIVRQTPEGFESISFFDKQTGLISSDQSSGLFPSRYKYDNLGRVTSIITGPSACTSGSDCRLTTIEYFPNNTNGAGSVSRIENPIGEVIEFEKDKSLRVTKNISNPGTAEELQKSFSYDAVGNMTSISPPEKPAYIYLLDELDTVTGFESPAVSGGSYPDLIAYEYDKDNKLTKTTYPDGQSIDITYNDGGDVSSVTSPRNSYSYVYDETTAQLLSTTDDVDGISLQNEYHGHLTARVTMKGFPNNRSNFKISFMPDGQLRIGRIIIARGGTYIYTYDNDSFLIGAGDMAYTRDSQNGFLGTSLLDTISTSQTYNGFGEVDTFVASHNSTDLYETNYTYDKLGRIVSRTEFIQGAVTTRGYNYDSNGRLIEVSGPDAVSFSYDANGNRLNNTTVYDEQDRLLSDANYNYVYTTRGSLREKNNKSDASKITYDYDLFGNLLTINLPSSGLIQYVHGPRNRRIGKKVNGTLTHGFVYKDQLNPIAQFDQNGAITHQFIYGSKANVPDYLVLGGVNYRIISDERGSVRLVVNSNDGSVAQRIDYDVWGNVLQDTNPGFQPFGFAGGLYDPDTSLVRFGARDYDPSIGRWLNKDPIKFDGGFNFYAYAGNDPVNFVDPKGEGIIGIGIGTAVMSACFEGVDSILLGNKMDSIEQISEDVKSGQCTIKEGLERTRNEAYDSLIPLPSGKELLLKTLCIGAGIGTAVLLPF